jgi:hypothetical protein
MCLVFSCKDISKKDKYFYKILIKLFVIMKRVTIFVSQYNGNEFKKLQKIKIMTTSEFKTMTKEQQLTFLNPLVEYGMNSMLVGTLKKNIVRHWLNKGLPLETAENLAELSELKAQEFKKNKLK